MKATHIIIIILLVALLGLQGYHFYTWQTFLEKSSGPVLFDQANVPFNEFGEPIFDEFGYPITDFGDDSAFFGEEDFFGPFPEDEFFVEDFEAFNDFPEGGVPPEFLPEEFDPAVVQ